MDPIEKLKEVLQNVAPDPISEDLNTGVIRALESAWLSFSGHEEQSTTASKIRRAEKLEWQRPVLRFVLERHGGTVNGSSRAELHHWEVDLDARTAKIVTRRLRQLRPLAKVLKVEPLAAAVAEAIRQGKKQEGLAWKSPSLVQIQIGRLIPETNQQTTAARRKRFRKVLGVLMQPMGWNERSGNLYEKTCASS